MRSVHGDQIARRLEGLADMTGDYESLETKNPWGRYSIDARWIAFECGCRAERCNATVDARNFDPIIFKGLPEQAVYDSVCHLHGPSMNVIVSFGGYKDFAQWRIHRRDQVMGR